MSSAGREGMGLRRRAGTVSTDDRPPAMTREPPTINPRDPIPPELESLSKLGPRALEDAMLGVNPRSFAHPPNEPPALMLIDGPLNDAMKRARVEAIHPTQRAPGGPDLAVFAVRPTIDDPITFRI